MSKYKEIARQYFSSFSNKDAAGLAELFAEDVGLRDWEIAVSGKSSVLQANQNIFDTVGSIEVIPVLVVEEGDVVIAQLEIILNGKENLRVVDILRFASDGTIRQVTAYKG